MTETEMLSEERLKEIEAQPPTFYCNKCGWFGTDGPTHPNCNYHAVGSLSDTTINALCQAVRALRAELERVSLAQSALTQLDELQAANKRAAAGNTALREQLAESERVVKMASSYERGARQKIEDLESQLAQVEKERADAREMVTMQAGEVHKEEEARPRKIFDAGFSTKPLGTAREAAEEIVKAWLWHTHEHDQERARASIEQIIARHFPASAEGVGNLQRRLYEECVTANWDPERKNTFAEEIAHLHEELSEAFRAFRRYKDFEVREVNGKLEGVPIEFADALIGMFYNAELYGFDLLEAVERKHQFNLNRNYVAEGRQLHAPEAALEEVIAALKASPASPTAPVVSDCDPDD